MAFRSIADICKQFELDPTLDISQLIKELTKIQAKLHPDVNPNYSEKDAETLSEIEEAKKFLREHSEQHLVPISDVMEIIKLVKSESVSNKIETEIMENQITQTSLSIMKNVKTKHLPYKITAASIWALITLIWAFPSLLMQHPIIGSWVLPETLYLILTIVWLGSLLLLFPIFLFAYTSEKHAKMILEFLKSSDNQYEFFAAFRYTLEFNEKTSFTQKELTEFLYGLIFHDSFRYSNAIEQLYEMNCELFYRLNFISDKRNSLFINKRNNRFIRSQVSEIMPKISDMIIARLLEKDVITKKSERNWYDVYELN